MRAARDPNPVVGRCWACHEPVRRVGSVRLYDPQTPGNRRLVHRGECEDRARVMLGPTIEGGGQTT